MMHRFLLAFSILSVSATSPCFSQKIQGEWKISEIVTGAAVQEYTLTPLHASVHHDYGNHFELKEGNSFSSWYTAPCGNHCFTSSRGKYRFIDDDHIELILDTVWYHGECSNQVSPLDFPVNAGVYYVNEDSAGVLLIKSDANLEQDKRNLIYTNFIDSSLQVFQRYANLAEEIKPDSVLLFNTESIVELYLSSIGKSEVECKLLYSKLIGYRGRIVLIELDGDYKIIVSNATGLPEKRTIHSISTYDLSGVHRSLENARNIDFQRRRWEVETTKEEKGSYHELTKIHKIKDEVVKVVFDKVFKEGIVRIEYYLKEGLVFYIRQSADLDRNGRGYPMGCEFFVKSDGDIVRRNLSEPGKYVDCDSYYSCKARLEEILSNYSIK